MKIIGDVERASYKPEVVIGIDPGAVNTGVVVVKKGKIVHSFTAKTSDDFYNELSCDTDITGECLTIIEKPFGGPNMKSYLETCQVVGYIKGMLYFLLACTPKPESIFITPQQGNKAIGLESASSHDIAKMNMSFVNGWNVHNVHEVSAYAVVLAAEQRGLFEWA